MMVGGYAVLKRRINLVMLESSKGGGSRVETYCYRSSESPLF